MIKPVAVITCLEDSPSFLDRELIKLYLRTRYIVDSMPDMTPGFTLCIGAASRALDDVLEKTGAAGAAYITAWNPHSTLLPLAENRRRNEQLRQWLQTICPLVLTGRGEGPDPAWQAEESFLAVGTSPETAADIARRFDQNALVWAELHQPARLHWVG